MKKLDSRFVNHGVFRAWVIKLRANSQAAYKILSEVVRGCCDLLSSDDADMQLPLEMMS